MATPIVTRYTLSEQELLEGAILNQSQICLMQTELADVNIQLSELQIDVNNPLAAAQEQAFLRGQQKLYQHMLDRSEKAQEVLSQPGLL